MRSYDLGPKRLAVQQALLFRLSCRIIKRQGTNFWRNACVISSDGIRLGAVNLCSRPKRVRPSRVCPGQTIGRRMAADLPGGPPKNDYAVSVFRRNGSKEILSHESESENHPSRLALSALICCSTTHRVFALEITLIIIPVTLGAMLLGSRARAPSAALA